MDTWTTGSSQGSDTESRAEPLIAPERQDELLTFAETELGATVTDVTDEEEKDESN